MAFRDAVLADSPLFYYEFNETSGTALADSSGNSRPGTLITPATLGVAGMNSGTGKAASFTGGRVDVAWANGKTFSGDYTVEIIAKWSNKTDSQLFTMVNSTGNVQGPSIYWNTLLRDKTKTVNLYFRDAFVTGYEVWDNGNYADSVYRHLAFVRRGLSLEIWVNGALTGVATLPAANSFIANANASFMGNIYSQYCSGSLDEAVFYSSALLPKRIKYHAALAGNMSRVAGTAKLDTGAAASLVVTRDWNTRALVDQIAPDPDGSFQLYSTTSPKLDVTVFGPDGYQPITHGPITPVPVV